MAEKKEEATMVEVELIADHTHGGKLYRQGDKITVRKRQVEKLREWGKVK